MPWAALVSAVVGAVIATGAGALLERARWRRERSERSAGVRRVLYGEYLEQLSQARNVFRGLARSPDLPRAEREQAARSGFAACYGLRYQMSITAPDQVVRASETAFRALRDVRDLAAGGVAAGDPAYVTGRESYEDALAALRAGMRRTWVSIGRRAEGPGHRGPR
ncbi:hypothetical protein IAG44_26745 [Streptomyces roseirectus]|uniref:Uncharacterized protein n=1 Tax=Streptomyces roseirectus TaxID=2768066 RepID=A0A7H0IIQ4_9ACTN|nr:hypothetical protein [Streptomyces roseirectus]QNP72670.1 hypothetical protein IAG44_26745 [Streptomyces roseirectus]